MDAAVATRPVLPAIGDDARSPDPAVCPFFRLDANGSLVAPLRAPDEDHRCVAIDGPRAQSIQQQELVCLRAAHVDCPRYRRAAPAPAKRPAAARRPPAVPRATLAALVVLAFSAAISFGFVLKRGGIDMPVVGATPAPTDVAAATTSTATPGGSASTGIVTPEGSAQAVPSVAPSAPTGPSPAPTPKPTKPAPRPTPKPTAATGGASASRLAVLVPCPGQSGCYIYTVRSGDNLFSIAHWFGVPLTTLYAWNPTVKAAGIHPGLKLRIPTPTR